MAGKDGPAAGSPFTAKFCFLNEQEARSKMQLPGLQNGRPATLKQHASEGRKVLAARGTA